MPPVTWRALGLVALAAALCTPARAQEPMPQPVRPPRALVERLFADFPEEDEFDDLVSEGVDSLAKWITVTRRDFNGDGVREWEVEGTRYCGQNCARWIYRRLPSGRFRQVYAGGGVSLGILPGRSHGWHDVREYWHMSCCEGPSLISVFDGRRYQWRETRYLVWDDRGRPRTAYRVYLTPPEAPGPRRLVLDPFDAGGGLWISARYDVCRPGRARTDVCGAPRLVLSSARLPVGRVCVRMRANDIVAHREYQGRAGGGWCGVTGPDARARGRRRLVLRPSREDWARMRTYGAGLTGPGLPSQFQAPEVYGLGDFATRLEHYYRFPCIEGYWCVERDQRRNR